MPRKDFNRLGNGTPATPPTGEVVWKHFFDLLGRDLGLTADRVWVTKGPPKDGEVPPASK